MPGWKQNYTMEKTKLYQGGNKIILGQKRNFNSCHVLSIFFKIIFEGLVVGVILNPLKESESNVSS